jgi:hypothetical protein
MAVAWFCGMGLVAVGAGIGAALVAEPVPLREEARPGQVTRAVVELKAEGLYQPGRGEAGTERPSPLKVRVQTRLAFRERVLAAAPGGAARRVVRWVDQAAAAINGDGAFRPTASALRPEEALLVVERRREGILAFSPGGPLTRPELELVQGPCDPLALATLLPEKPVAVGDHWPVGDEAARSLSGYDALAVNALRATLESLDDASARIALKGEVRGAVLGGEGVITCSGTLTFDRRQGRITSLRVDRSEDRQPGPVEAGLDVTSTLTLDRGAAEPPPELAEAALAGLPTDPSPARELLLYAPPEGQYTLLHDRAWHTFAEDSRRTVLKRLDRGEVVAQCNLSAGPHAGKGRHQDLQQFRDDIRRALGRRFGAFLGAGELDGTPAQELRYKVAVQGKEGDVPIVWLYYLVANPEGDQMLALFTLAEGQLKRFADQDLQMIGSLQWKAEPPRRSP